MAFSAIGGWMASAGIAKLVDQVCCYAGDQYEYQRDDAKKKLTRLEESLRKIQAVVHKADSLQKKNPSMESWLGSIKDAVYHAENVLNLFEYRVLEAEDAANSCSSSTAGSFSSINSATTMTTTPSTSTSSSSTLSRSARVLRRFIFSDGDLNELIAIVGRFDKIASEMPTLLKLVKIENRRSEPSIQWRKTTSMLGTTEFYGRVCEKTQLENLIVQTHDKSSQPYSVISVVGLPGVGKTALVQRVYSHFRDIGYFDIMAWIHVSEKFDAERLTKEMIQAHKWCKMKRRRDGISRISGHASMSADWNSMTNFDQLQQILQENLNGNKIFVVLDDIWNEMSSQWENLSKPLQFASKGSKVLLTTRSHRVAEINGATEIVPLDGLKDEDFWGHFTKCAFGNEPPANYPQLENIGRQIAKKLAGSPLAARTVGGKLILERHEDHWRSVLGCKLGHIEQKEDDIIPALRLSYEHLPDNLKQCFVYFALFPKKYPLTGDILIQMWRAQGYIQEETRDEKTHNYIQDLLQLSFIQKATNLDDHYVVHDLLHDFAELVSNGEHFRIEDDFHVSIPENVRHLYVNASNIFKVFISLTENKVKKGLRSLIICKHDPASGDGIPPSNFNKTLEETLHQPQLRSLRVLVLHDQDGMLPENIGNLIHLRYLDISGSRITNFPESLFKLYHLQWLNLQFCYNNNVKVGLQKGISRLTQLRYLMAPLEIITGIEHIGRLTFLRTLDEYHVMRDSRYSICQLKELNELRGKLTIKNLEKVRCREESSEARLIKKQSLKKISFCWNHLQGVHSNSIEHAGTFEGLRPNCNLRELHVTRYMGTKSPTWLAREYLPNIQTIELVSCHHWKRLPPFGSLPFLRVLKIRNFKAVEKIDTGFYGDSATVFPSLEELLFENMDQWKEWSSCESNQCMFPSLRNIYIKQCKEWKGPLPLPVPSKGINISVSDWLSANVASSSSLKAATDIKKSFRTELFLDHYELLFGCLSPSSLATVHVLNLSSRYLVSFNTEQEEWLQKLTSVKEVHFTDSANLTSLPMNLVHLTTLQSLYIEKCPKLKSFPQMGLPLSLKKLRVIKCNNKLTALCSRINISDVIIVPQEINDEESRLRNAKKRKSTPL